MHLFIDRPFEAEGKSEQGRCVDLHCWLLDESIAQKALALCFGPGDCLPPAAASAAVGKVHAGSDDEL